MINGFVYRVSLDRCIDGRMDCCIGVQWSVVSRFNGLLYQSPWIVVLSVDGLLYR